MAKITHHVVPSPNGGWSVKKGGAEKASKHFDEKKTAVDYAKSVSKKQRSDLYIHKKDGTIQAKNSHDEDQIHEDEEDGR